MNLKNWELSFCPSERDKSRWKLKLKIEEKELMPFVSCLSGTLGRPFMLEHEEYDFALYIYDVKDEELAKLEKILISNCIKGDVIRRKEVEPLDIMLNKVVQSIETIQPPAPFETAVPPPVLFRDLDLNPRYTFEDFVIGPNNRFTAAAAQAVADNPGKIYNPFFVYGGVGLGKTHLMHAVGHYVCRKNPQARILYVTSEKFMGDVIDSIRKGSLLQMREYYRQADLLMVDDIQFLVESESTQEEFFHTFNVLHQVGHQIIITSDRPPRQLTTLESRLRSRFEWGLIADMKSPNLETRVAILKKKGETEHFKLDDNMLLYIASKLKSNIRELEGFLKRINAYASLTHQEVNMELVRSVMADLAPDEEPGDVPLVITPDYRSTPQQPQPSPGVAPAAPPPQPHPPVSQESAASNESLVVPPPAPVVQQPPVPPPKAPKPTPIPVRSDGGKSAQQEFSSEIKENLKVVEVGFFFPEGKTDELFKVKERFAEVIRKHKLKFRLEGVFEQTYKYMGKMDYSLFVHSCKDNNMRIAIVLGPPPEANTVSDDFANLLSTVMDDAGISLQLVSWLELNKDYRYLNLSLDITLLKHGR
jgi:chromosomal replication initiator protein DnaA